MHHLLHPSTVRVRSKAVLESKPKITVSREKAAAQRRKVEEMLRRSNDPKAFVQQKKENPELTPGKETLLARKKWVIETLHKQNDPKLFIDQRRNSGTTLTTVVCRRRTWRVLMGAIRRQKKSWKVL